MVREGGGGEDQLLVVGSYCHDVLFRDGRAVAETLGGAASFISNVLDALFPPSSSSSPPFQGHRYVSKVGADFAYAVSYPSLVTASAPTTLFHAHFSSDPNAAGCHGDRALRRVHSCDPILPCDLPSYRFACGLAVGVAGEIPPETLARMLDICRFVFVDAQALIRTFDPVDGTVGLVPLRDTAFFPLLPRIGLLKASAEEAPFVDIERARKWCCIIVTEGKDGCTVYWKDGDFHVPAFPTVQVDPTGAGDSFLGGFVAGLLSGLTVQESALLGNFFGSVTVSQTGIPKLDRSMLQKVTQELERMSIQRSGFPGKTVLLDFHVCDVHEDFWASLNEASRWPCSQSLTEISDDNDEYQQKLELESSGGVILPIKPR